MCSELDNSEADCIDFYLDSDAKSCHSFRHKKRRCRSKSSSSRSSCKHVCPDDMPGYGQPFFGPNFGVRGDSSSDFSSDEEGGVPRLRIEDQLCNLPARFRRDNQLCNGRASGYGEGCLQNDIDIVKACQTTETCDVPDKYTANIGVENNWAN